MALKTDVMTEKIGALYRHKATGVVFVFDGDPGDLFVRNMVGLHRPDFTECREVANYHFEREYEPIGEGSKWTSVAAVLPPPRTVFVAVYPPDGAPFATGGIYWGEPQGWSIDDTGYTTDVRFWMDIPTLPERAP